MTDRPAHSTSAADSTRDSRAVSNPENGPSAEGDTMPEAADYGPLTLRLAVLLLWIQAACVAILAVAEIIQLVAHGTDRFEWAAWVIAGPFVAAVALWAAGRLLVNRRPAGRGLAVAIELCAIPAVFFMVTGDNDLWVRIVGAFVGLSVVVAVGLVTAPPSRRALFGS